MLRVLEIAESEVGYLEKASSNQLDSKTANAGSGNFTKYARDLYPSLQGQPWCDMFVDWCMVQAYGKSEAKRLLCGGFSAYTPTSAEYYRSEGRFHSSPQVGDQIFFRDSSRICHTGLVYKVSGGRVYTIEGNTSGASGLVANGGGVAKKSYAIDYAKIAGYGRPDYSGQREEHGMDTLHYGDSGQQVAALQIILRDRFGYAVLVDGELGPATTYAVKHFQQESGLDTDGIIGPLTWAQLLD